MNPDSERLEQEYDALHYPNAPVLKTHPANLASLARLFGLDPAPVAGCRVLELGCSSGENLLPMALNLPGSEFVGVDLSAEHLAVGRRRAESLGASNLQLLHRDILDLDGALGTFDYILCHGVFSWVPPAVQDKILGLCGELLAPAGVAYVSYNAYPGWHLLGMLRGMLLRTAGAAASPRQKVARARQTLAFLRHSIGMGNNDVAPAIRPALDRLSRASDGYLFHEYLTASNEAFWFEEFVARAQEHGLGYLANAVPDTMTPSNFSQGIVAGVVAGRGPIAQQQRLDMALGRGFNSTLLCRGDQPVTRDLSGEVLQGLSYDATLEPDPSVGDVHDPEPLRVRSSSGCKAYITGADLRIGLGILHSVRPRGLSFDDLFAGILAELPDASRDPDERRLELAGHLARLYFGAVVGITTDLPAMTSTVSERPIASPLVRLQASEQSWVTNQWHQAVELSEQRRRLLSTLDGTVSPQDPEALAFFARNALLVG